MKSRYSILVVAWCLYFASLVSPAATVPRDDAGWFETETVVGWRTAVWCLRLNLESVPIRTWHDRISWGLLWFWPLSNLLMLATPLVFWLSGQRIVPKWALLMGAATLANASAFFLIAQGGGGLTVGYYLWCLSFAVATIGCICSESRRALSKT